MKRLNAACWIDESPSGCRDPASTMKDIAVEGHVLVSRIPRIATFHFIRSAGEPIGCIALRNARFGRRSPTLPKAEIDRQPAHRHNDVAAGPHLHRSLQQLPFFERVFEKATVVKSTTCSRSDKPHFSSITEKTGTDPPGESIADEHSTRRFNDEALSRATSSKAATPRPDRWRHRVIHVQWTGIYSSLHRRRIGAVIPSRLLAL